MWWTSVLFGQGSLTTTGLGWQGDLWEREAETCWLEQEEAEEVWRELRTRARRSIQRAM